MNCVEVMSLIFGYTIKEMTLYDKIILISYVVLKLFDTTLL